MEADCLLPYDGEAFFPASLSEPMSCIVGAFHASYHIPPGTYNHNMGIRKGGNMAILAGVGPMGLGAIDYALNQERKPGLIAVTELGDAIMGFDGCLNFFAGPVSPEFKAEINFYNVHYAFTHIVGTSGGNTDDMRESLKLMDEGKINPAVMITHIGGLDSVIDTTLNLPQIPGGKKLIYTNISMPLVDLTNLGELGNKDAFYAGLHEIVSKNDNTWSMEAERYLLANAKPI